MNIISHQIGDIPIAEVQSDKLLFSNVDDALDVIGNVYYQGYYSLIVHKNEIDPVFFELKNKLAGEILQKFTNYRMRLVIIGDFSELHSNSLRSFMVESNKGRQVNFLTSLEKGLERLCR